MIFEQIITSNWAMIKAIMVENVYMVPLCVSAIILFLLVSVQLSIRFTELLFTAGIFPILAYKKDKGESHLNRWVGFTKQFKVLVIKAVSQALILTGLLFLFSVPVLRPWIMVPITMLLVVALITPRQIEKFSFSK